MNTKNNISIGNFSIKDLSGFLSFILQEDINDTKRIMYKHLIRAYESDERILKKSQSIKSIEQAQQLRTKFITSLQSRLKERFPGMDFWMSPIYSKYENGLIFYHYLELANWVYTNEK